MGTFILKRKTFTLYDDTDRLKQMKDSDILAEQKKTGPSLVQLVPVVAGGAAVGGLAFGIRKAAGGKGGTLRSAKKGALLGGLALGAYALHKRNKELKEVNAYNDRLAYAQRQAKRREKADWSANMTQRQGYSY